MSFKPVFFAWILSLLFPLISMGQTSEKYNSEYAGFYRAEELFEKEQYSAARYEFRQFIDGFQHPNDPLFIKALYYEGLSALELYNNDAIALLENFIRLYPESIYRPTILFRLGNYFYQKKDFDGALKWYNQLPAADVDPEDLSEYYFKLGYANFEEGNVANAKSAFYEIKDGSSMYSAPALYYYSHISYDEGNYQTALEGFQKLGNDERFEKVVPYYIAQIYHLQGNYEAVTEYASSVTDTSNVANRDDINHLIGDAYYRTGRYDEAAEYLEAYNKSSKTTRDDDYQLGYAYYKSQQYENAIRMFDRVSRKKDTLGQVALYHIGESYLKLDDYAAARSAFEAASLLSYNPQIEEDALFNFAILSYKLDINPYNEAVDAFETYLTRYPDSKRKNDVYQYLVNVYTQTNNYGKALSSLDALPDKDIRLKTAYQIVAFNYGVEQYQKGQYQKAVETLSLVDKYPVDQQVSAKAVYWMADAYYRLAKYPQAITYYKKFVALPSVGLKDLSSKAYYNIGYAYLEDGDRISSNENFRIFVSQEPKPSKLLLFDAYMRIADNYYVRKENLNAVEYYRKAVSLTGPAQDQAIYYLSRSLGFAEQGNERVKLLSDIINNYPHSKYMITAIGELALIYKERGEYDKSFDYYQQIIRDYPNSPLVKDAELSIADIYYKKKDFAKAETKYLEVLSKYASADRQLCEDAGKGLLEIYRVTNSAEKTEQLTDKYPCTQISKEEQESIYFTPGKDAYDQKKYEEAVPLLEKYLEKFPNGIYASEVRNYLANSLYNLERTDDAIALYRITLEGPNNGFTETAAVRVSKYLYNNGDFTAAIPYYEKLLEVSNNPEIIWNAQIGLMRSNYLIENYTNAAIYADKVLENSLTKTAIRLEAEYSKGMSNFYLENYDAAKSSLEYVSKNTTTEIGAETKFSLAQLYYNQDNLTKADSEARALLKMKPAYDFWIAKALMLQSKILIRKEDLFQAEQTLKSVIDHYPNQDDGILAEARQLYDELMQLKEKPKEVEDKNKPIIDLNGEN